MVLSHDRQWGASPLSDQQTAGGILWVSGDVVGLIVFAAIFVQWVRDSEREARREDRRLDRLDAAAARRSDPAPRPAPGRRSAPSGAAARASGPSIRSQPQREADAQVDASEEPR